MNPRKKQRTEESLRRELSSIILYELKDPRMGFVTLTGVEISQDCRSAKVRLLVRGTEEETALTLQGLQHARGYIQALINKRMDLRYTPILQFEEDKEVRRVMRVQQMIDKARKEDREYRP